MQSEDNCVCMSVLALLHIFKFDIQEKEKYIGSTMYFKGRITLFFTNNYLTEYRITMEF